MGFAAIAASAILIVLAIVIVLALTYNMLNWFGLIVSASKSMSSEISEKMNKIVKIIGVKYNSTENTLLINITNYGSESIIIGKEDKIILDYIDINGTRHIELLSYPEWTPNSVYIGNYTMPLSSPIYVELLPGTICELKVTLNYEANTSEPLVVVFVLPSGGKAEYVFISGG